MLATTLLFGGDALAQAEICTPPFRTATCQVNTAGTLNECQIQANYYPVTGLMSMHVGAGVQCTHSASAPFGYTNYWNAARMVGDPSTYACMWSGMYYNAVGMFRTFTCTISMADGLPVELLEASVE